MSVDTKCDRKQNRESTEGESLVTGIRNIKLFAFDFRKEESLKSTGLKWSSLNSQSKFL